MPIFTNNAKIEAKQIDNGLVQLGVAISFEAAYNLMNDEYCDTGSREEYLAWITTEESEESDEDTTDWTHGYEEWREEEYEGAHTHDYLSHM